MAHLLADLDATCSALGCSDGERYHAGPDAIQCLKHLIWIMRRDGDNHEYRRHIGKAKVLQIDLLHILMDYGETDEEYFDIVVRLLIILTTPTLLLYKDGPPKEIRGRRVFMDLIEILQDYKSAFANNRIWEVLFNKLKKTIEIDWALRTEDQGILIERILVLTRNVLQVPANLEDEGCIDGEANLHDQIIWVLHHSRILDLVLFIISSRSEKQYHLHCLEIIYHLFREQEAENLVRLSLKEEKERDEQELCALRLREKKQTITKPHRTRHSRFGGTFVLRNLKSFSGRDIICHHPLKRAEDYDFDQGKAEKKRPHHNANSTKPLKRRSAFPVRLCLREYCVEILASTFNTMIAEGRQLITANGNEKSADMSYLLWAIRFFMEYNRLSDMKLEVVSGALSVQSFHWTLTSMQHMMDMMVTQKKEKMLWSKRLHIAIQTFRELLYNVMALQKLQSESAKALFKMLLNNVCYVVEYRETILHLLLNYNEAYNSRAFLLDVIETANVFTKMMEGFCKNSTVVLQDRKRVKKSKSSKKTSRKDKKSSAYADLTQDELCNKWTTIADEIASLLMSQELSVEESVDTIPFDAASEKSIDDQKGDCMIRIHKFLHNGKLQEAIKLIRGAREVWTDDDAFGTANQNPEEELLMMREIFMHRIASAEEMESDGDEESENDEDDRDNELEEGDAQLVERAADINDFVKRLLHPKVVHACVIVLTDWRTISTRSLKAVVTVLHRIAYKCSCPAMLYHVKLFRIFQEVFHAGRDAHHEELHRLGIFIIRKFGENVPKNPKIFAELLFYKTIREANELESGYDDTYEGSMKGSWTEEQEAELRYLFEENQRNPETDRDVIDWLLENLIDKNRTRRGVMKKLREMGLKFSAPTKKSSARTQSGAARSTWSPSDDVKLQDLYDEHRADDDCLLRIEAAFEGQRSKDDIIKRMIKLHLIANRAEIWPSGLPEEEEEMEFVERSESQMRLTVASRSNDGNDRNTRRTLSNTKVAKSRKRPRKKFNAMIVKNLLSELLLEEKNVDNVKWLAECLTEAIEEAAEMEKNGQNDDDDDGEDNNDIPLVPLKPNEKEAVDNQQFQKLLKALGIQAPISGTERYWRIPASFGAGDLQLRLSILNGETTGDDAKDGDDGHLEEETNDDGVESAEEDLQQSDDNDNDEDDSIDARSSPDDLEENHDRKEIADNEEEKQSDEEEIERISTPPSPSKESLPTKDAAEDSSDDDVGESSVRVSNRKRRLFSNSDSDDALSSARNEESSKGVVLEDEDSQESSQDIDIKQATKRRRVAIITEDDEDDE